MDSLQNPLTEWFERLGDQVVKYKNVVIVVLVAAIAGGAGFVGYRYYRSNVQVAAHKDFMQALRYFDAPVKKEADVSADQLYFASAEEKWQKVAQVFKDGYNNNKSSDLAPMFQSFWAEALIKQGKLSEAIDELKGALNTMVSDDLKQLYSVKLSLMQLDSKNEQESNEGLERLKQIAYNTQNASHGLALYHLGMHAWTNKKFGEAKSYWQQFVVKFSDERALNDKVNVVKSKLDLIAV